MGLRELPCLATSSAGKMTSEIVRVTSSIVAGDPRGMGLDGEDPSSPSWVVGSGGRAVGTASIWASGGIGLMVAAERPQARTAMAARLEVAMSTRRLGLGERAVVVLPPRRSVRGRLYSSPGA